jgi:transposase
LPRGPQSSCKPFGDIIELKLEQGLSGKRIHQDLVADHGFAHGYDSVKRYIRRLGRARSLPMRRLESSPGQEAQVDLGTGGMIVGVDGRRRKTHVFRIVLSHSRKGYSEVVFRQNTDSLLQCLENAFWHFGGVPKTTVIDNPRAFVKHPDWYDPELNPRLASFAEHYGTVILPTKPYTPRHKGKIERGIAYVKDNALKGRRFASLAEENRHLLQWETAVADTRIHGTTRKQVGKIFETVERPALGPLPAGRFPLFQEAQRSVHRDGHVEVAKAYYSVPPEYVGRCLWVRWDGRLVRIFNKRMEQVAVHAQQEPGRFSTKDEHIHARKFSKVERGATWLLQRTGLIGPQAERWGKAMLEERGIAGLRVLVGLQSLAGTYSHQQIDNACEVALSHGVYRLRPIRNLLKHSAGDGAKQEQFEFMAAHEIIRDMDSYGDVIRRAMGLPENHNEKGKRKDDYRITDDVVA